MVVKNFLHYTSISLLQSRMSLYMSVLRDSTRASSPGTSRTTPCMKSMNPKWEDENKNRCILVSTVLGGQNIVHERTVSWRRTRAVVWQILGWTSCMSSSGSLSCQFQFFGAQQRPIQAVFFYFLSGVRCSWINYWISEKWNLYKTGSWSWSWILMFSLSCVHKPCVPGRCEGWARGKCPQDVQTLEVCL